MSSKISALTSRATLAITDTFTVVAGGVNYRAVLSALLTLFRAQNGSGYVLAQSAVAVGPHTGTTAKTALATVAIPAGAMGINGRIRVVMQMSYTSAAAVKTWTIDFGGTTFFTTAPTTTGVNKQQCDIWNRGAANSQLSHGGMATGGWGGAAGAIVTGAVDTTVAQDVVISVALADGGNSATLEAHAVELFPRA